MNVLETEMKSPLGQIRKHAVLIVNTVHPGHSTIEEQLSLITNFEPEVVSADNIKSNPKRYAPDVVVLDIAGVSDTELDILMTIRSIYGDVPIVVVSEALEDADVRQLLKLKVHDWFRKPLVFSEFKNAIQSGIRNSKQSSNHVHAVISAVGGAGATTIAVSLADILARKLKRGAGTVGLFDLDFSTGACGYLLNMSSSFNLNSVITNPSRIDSEFVNLIHQKHENGFFVYSFKRRDMVTHINLYELVLRLLDVVTMQHAHTVLDIPYYETEWRQEVLSAVNTVTIVSEFNLPAIKHTLDILKSIADLPGGAKSVHVILNKRERRLFGGGRIKTSKLKELFGDTPFIVLPRDTSVLEEAMDRGVPASDVNSSSRFLVALTKYATKILLAEKVVS